MICKKYGNQFSKQYIGEDIINEHDPENSLSLVLMNTHYSFNYPRPMIPGVIEVGGIGIGKLKRLPQVSELCNYNENHFKQVANKNKSIYTFKYLRTVSLWHLTKFIIKNIHASN